MAATGLATGGQDAAVVSSDAATVDASTGEDEKKLSLSALAAVKAIEMLDYDPKAPEGQFVRADMRDDPTGQTMLHEKRKHEEARDALKQSVLSMDDSIEGGTQPSYASFVLDTPERWDTFALPSWYNTLQGVTPPSTFLPLSGDAVRYLLADEYVEP